MKVEDKYIKISISDYTSEGAIFKVERRGVHEYEILGLLDLVRHQTYQRLNERDVQKELNTEAS